MEQKVLDPLCQDLFGKKCPNVYIFFTLWKFGFKFGTALAATGCPEYGSRDYL